MRFAIVSAVALFAAASCGGSPEDSDMLSDDSWNVVALTMPGVIEAEDYNRGGEGVGFHDTTSGNQGGEYRSNGVDVGTTTDSGGGYYVGWTEAGEWLEFTATAASKGTYTFSARVASGASGTKSLHLVVDGKALPAASFTDASGWQSWRDLALGSATLTAGSHQIRLVLDTGKANVNFLATTLSAPPPAAKALLGMSAPDDLWAQRVSEVGPGLQARRIFLRGFDASLALATEACNDQMYPILSYKTGSYSWADVGAGRADAELRSLATRLAALPCPVFVAIHHEPAGDGAAADWAKMQVHALPILGAGPDVKVGVIANGWWWSGTNQGYTDAEIAEYIPPAVRAVADVIAADTYQSTATSEEAAPKIRRMGEWARRMGDVKALGVGEFNGHTAASITNATNALAADPLFAWGCVWNSDGGVATVLTGDRLQAFRTALANW